MATISKTLTLEVRKFSQSFLPLVPPWGRSSRGNTPLHFAAAYRHVGVVQQLLEAEAAMDAQNNTGRGLGRGFEGETLLRQWDCCKEMDEMLILQGFGGFLFSPFYGKSAKTCAPPFCFVPCDHDFVVSSTLICFLEMGLRGRTLLLSFGSVQSNV